MLEDSAAPALTTASRQGSICQPLAHGGVLSGAADMTNSTAALLPQGATVPSWGAKLQPLEHIQTPLWKGAVSNGQKR
jgi:hypothetical protein